MRIFSEITVVVKCWASKRGIYNFNLGYLNGISLMIMVAKAMQEFFNLPGVNTMASLSTDYDTTRQALIEYFFSMYAEWPWNGKFFEERAIYLVHPEQYLM